MEKGQWKVIERDIADALTSLEKQKLELEYRRELEKVNWKALEQRLENSFAEINWDKVNEQLGSAIVNIKLDSLQLVYKIALERLDLVEEYVVENKCQETV